LRKILRYPDAVSFSAARLALNSERCWVDAWEFERRVAAPNEALNVETTLALYRGRFLGDDENPHAFEARDRWRRKFVRTVLAVGQRYERSNRSAAISLYERALDVELSCQEFYRRLISATRDESVTNAALA